MGSAICSRRSPWLAIRRNAMRMTGSAAFSQDMKRIPVVIAESGVFGMTSRIREIRSHGFSLCHFTPTERFVELVKSIAS